MLAGKLRMEWAVGDGVLAAIEPTPEEVAAAAEALALAYGDPHNSAMMALSGAMSAGDVVEHYAGMKPPTARPFLLQRDGVLVGDADLRHIEGGRGEVAILIGARAEQGRGLGTRFALMLHAFAFRGLGLDRVYATIVPENAASLRLFEKLGYRADDGPTARSYVDEPTDVSLSVSRVDFERAHRLDEIRIASRAA